MEQYSEVTEKSYAVDHPTLYEVDDDEVPTVLDLAAYSGEDEGCWEQAGCCCSPLCRVVAWWLRSFP